MAYYKLRLDVWCDWDPEDSDLEEIAQNISAGDAICTRRKVIAVVDRPQDIEDEAAMSFFGGRRGRCRSEPGVDPCCSGVAGEFAWWAKQNEPQKAFEGSVNDLAFLGHKEKASPCDEASVVFALI